MSDNPIIWRIMKLRIVECSLVDTPANDMATIESVSLAKRDNGERAMSKFTPEFVKYMKGMGCGYIVGEPDLPPFLKAKETYPTTGTATDSRGPGAQYGPTPEAMAEVSAVERFVEELATAITQLGEQNENSDLSPAEVLAQAVKIARQRMLAITDWSGDNGNADPSLNPNGPATNAARGRRTSGESADFNNMLNGFELAKWLRTRADDGGLVDRLSQSGRVPAGGLSSSLLKRDESDLRKFEDGAGDADCSHIIREPDELAKRLSARSDMRKAQDLSIASRDARVPEFRGSASPGCLGDDFAAALAKRLKNVQPTTIEDLLH